jgi:tyrosyl-tRNA synthetase
MDSVRLRLEREQPLSFIEFNYMVLQAYDFVELHRRYGCRAQMGASDQWGNIIMGVELGRRMAASELFGLTAPLLTTSAGEKMGKSAGNAVWLNADMLSPYDYWQYWRNTDDADVGRFLKLFTELPLDEIARLEKLEGNELNEAKKILATKATAILHGDEAAKVAAETADRIFGSGNLVASSAGMAGSGAVTGLPTISVPWFEVEMGVLLANLLHRAKLTKSTSEARRLIREGGVRLNDEPLSYEQRLVTTADLDENRTLKLSVGKKRHVIVRAD